MLIGINNKNSGWVIYPNPARYQLIVESKAGEEIRNAVIYTLAGQTVLRAKGVGKKLEIDTKGLGSGIYFIKVETDKGNGVRKFEIRN